MRLRLGHERSNRALQWRGKIIDPLFESLPDHAILYKLAKKLGFEAKTSSIEVVNDEPVIEDVLRKINRGAWTIGYTAEPGSGSNSTPSTEEPSTRPP